MNVSIRDVCTAIRSKQAGPYRLTLDIIFRTPEIYHQIKTSGVLDRRFFAELYQLQEDHITKLVYYDPGWALKISMIRPRVAGDPGDGDVYGCQQHAPLLEIEFDLPGSDVEGVTA